ncbi:MULTISPECIES: Hsp70 family protein [Giesbergeria]|uniref:Hsp70 family protein n=1 Tax=Giesbergeria sinuosa TaxID=80883 RepID=A0ABV9QI91_9BURK
MSARYSVGIDLGTSHTVVAYAALGRAKDAAGVQLLPMKQLVGPGALAEQVLLPSVRYHPAPGELPPVALQPMWLEPQHQGQAQQPPAVLGRYARDLGAQVPGRLVSSAKSWLSHAGVDRMAAILPWGAADDVPKISPVLASASYLAHVRAVWNARFPKSPLEQQDIILTVPASFDEGARALTLEAACHAGLPTVRLLEEPQAAFQDWLLRHAQHCADTLAQSRLVLVCDVGGGTTDLTLIQVEHGQGAVPQLTRMGVGDHLMLGGDNMDLALAHWVERRLGGTAPLSATRLAQLVQRCRVAKELLLGPDAPERATVTLLGAGSQLLGAARSVEISRADLELLVVDGFLPHEPASARPQRRRSGIVEFGLPYPADAAITRHLADFLARHAELGLPDTLLLNGGVFRAPALAQRLEQVLASWRGAPLQVLHNDAPDVAVARGAVAHALVRAGRVPALGAGIGGGSARSYFLLLEHSNPDTKPQGICVLPRGTPEGVPVHLADHVFALRLGQAVRFHLLSSSASTPWQAGDVVLLEGDDAAQFVRLPQLSAVLPCPEGQRRREVRVQLTASITEVGTLEMHCTQADDAAQRWSLAFELRGGVQGADAQHTAATAPPHPRLPEALAQIERIFGTGTHKPEAREVRQLRQTLERLLGRREEWSLPLLRGLFDALWAGAKRRRRSAEHERVWLNLAGYCLRPGTGAPLDAWRVEQLWTLFPQGIQYVAESGNWSEWWTLWRRTAAGLNEAQQLQLLEPLVGHLETIADAPRSKSPLHGSYDDMVRLAATLEQVPAGHRVDIGHWLLDRWQRHPEKAHTWWALGRLGARVPLYGSAHHVVPADTALLWLQVLLGLDWKQVEPAAFAAVQLARCSGDRARDLPWPVREQVMARLQAAKAPPAWGAMVREVLALDEADQRRSFGEALPPGLQLLHTGADQLG